MIVWKNWWSGLRQLRFRLHREARWTEALKDPEDCPVHGFSEVCRTLEYAYWLP